ncbi:hypothetical protein ADH76_00350 [Enterocloster clostridioformis]|nr:hypothetical protein [uncultured Acetatifactor sp.]ANU45119.1 hypothetical protein A4V08_04030 [Lachnoclostridium sp. YL32]KAI4442483.1 hypothetical protein C824_004996 [Schaedlerella arabinosiphila]NDO27506.1 hypothetical protein [Enterocloster clostridioformis]OXE69971.1 hypothetical protein ADH76_00350 [Enterocloster clostridioformis]QQR00118.1 hypothetical protein I5Q83_30595 [Enterocloster clostridioformis]
MTGSIELLSKLKLERLIHTLMYGGDSLKDTAEDYGEKIKNSFEVFTEKLKTLYGEVDGEDNRFFDIVSDFAEIHDDVYFEVGFFTGIQLMKNLEPAYGKGRGFHPGDFFIGKDGMDSSQPEESVLHQFIQTRMGTALEEALRKDEKFQKQNPKNSRIEKRLDRKDFTPEQWEAIDAALAENNDNAAEYGKMAYRQGALDLFSLLKELSMQA